VRRPLYRGGVPAREPLVVEFHEQRRSAIVDRMVEMARSGAGWINFSPGLDVDEPPESGTGLGALLGGRGPTVPLATWTPARRKDPTTIGIQHGEGPRAIRLLAERGVPLPDGWRTVQDHPRRGLVVVVPAGDTAAELDGVLGWLLRAAGALCPVPRTGEWRAYVHGA
jgi:hypothetical protein